MIYSNKNSLLPDKITLNDLVIFLAGPAKNQTKFDFSRQAPRQFEMKFQTIGGPTPLYPLANFSWRDVFAKNLDDMINNQKFKQRIILICPALFKTLF